MKKQISYRAVNFILALIEQVSLLEFPERTHQALFELQLRLEPIRERYRRERSFILLAHGGKWQTMQNGSVVIAEPEPPAKGQAIDDTYSVLLKVYSETCETIAVKNRALDAKSSGANFEPIFTKEEFQALCTKVGNVELKAYEYILVL